MTFLMWMESEIATGDQFGIYSLWHFRKEKICVYGLSDSMASADEVNIILVLQEAHTIHGAWAAAGRGSLIMRLVFFEVKEKSG